MTRHQSPFVVTKADQEEQLTLPFVLLKMTRFLWVSWPPRLSSVPSSGPALAGCHLRQGPQSSVNRASAFGIRTTG
jgi:hypothetical protein